MMESEGWDLENFPGLENVPFPSDAKFQNTSNNLSEDEFHIMISGGISGAITDPFSEEADEHAKRFYKAMRNIKGDDVFRIAKNTGYTVEQISTIKSYLFIQEHDLEDGFRRFDPSFIISESWRRLAYAPDYIQPHDLLLIQHELREMELVQQGYPQSDAHDITEEDFNYAHDAYEFHKRLHPRHNRLLETAVKKSSRYTH